MNRIHGSTPELEEHFQKFNFPWIYGITFRDETPSEKIIIDNTPKSNSKPKHHINIHKKIK